MSAVISSKQCVIKCMYHRTVQQDNCRELQHTRMNCKQASGGYFIVVMALCELLFGPNTYVQMHCLLYRVFLFLLNRQAPAQCSARRSASVASFATSRGGLQVYDHSDNNLRKCRAGCYRLCRKNKGSVIAGHNSTPQEQSHATVYVVISQSV
jgi:hypothetical protein